MPTICSRPEFVTAAWLSSVLQHAGISCVVKSFRQTNVGTGQVGQNVRFTLKYASGTGPETVIGKFLSDDPDSRQTGIERDTYFKEVRFYQLLNPTVDIQTPEILFTDIEPTSHEFSLIMEDLYPAKQGDQIQGCTIEDATLALEQLAKLHGPRWGDATLEQINWLSRPSPENAALSKTLWDSCWPGFLDRYAHQLHPAQVTLAEHFGANLAQRYEVHSGPLTITHGDYRLDNMLFGGTKPITIVDWQTPALGSGAADAAYFLGTSLPSGLRNTYEEQLLRSYHQALLRYDAVADYSFEQCWQDYRRFSLNGLFMAVIASMIVGRTERGDEMFLVMASRSAQMGIDLGAEAFY